MIVIQKIRKHNKSHPSWVRGLKQLSHFEIPLPLVVTPLAGAMIGTKKAD